jgi:LysM repeat protein
VAATASLAFDTVRAKKGQTLGTIAKARGVDVRRLAWYNPGVASSRRLAVGKVILVPAAHVIAASRDVPDPSIERYGTSGTSGGRVVHVVRRGESLGLIARRYRTTVVALQRANGLRRTVVYPGQSIIVRGGRRAPATRTAAARTTGKARSTTSAGKGVAKKAVAKKAAPKKAIAAKKAAPATGKSGR